MRWSSARATSTRSRGARRLGHRRRTGGRHRDRRRRSLRQTQISADPGRRLSLEGRPPYRSDEDEEGKARGFCEIVADGVHCLRPTTPRETGVRRRPRLARVQWSWLIGRRARPATIAAAREAAAMLANRARSSRAAGNEGTPRVPLSLRAGGWEGRDREGGAMVAVSPPHLPRDPSGLAAGG